MRTHILIAALILSTSVSAHAGASRGLSVPQPSPVEAPAYKVQAAQPALPADTSAVQAAPVAQQPIAQQPVAQQPVSQPSAADQQAAAQQQAAQQQAMRQKQMQMKKAQMQQARMMQMKKQQMMQQRMANMSLEEKVGYKVHQVKTKVKMVLVRALLN
jgi:flagellar biosynthesis GTPase FlhF